MINKIVIVSIQRSGKFEYTIKRITIYIYNVIPKSSISMPNKNLNIVVRYQKSKKGTNLHNLANWYSHGILYKKHHLTILDHHCLSKPHGKADIFYGYAHVDDTIYNSAFVESPSSQNLAFDFPIFAGPHPSHSVS